MGSREPRIETRHQIGARDALGHRHVQHRVGPLVVHGSSLLDEHRGRCCFVAQLTAAGSCQAIEDGTNGVSFRQPPVDGLIEHHPLVGHPDAEGRQDARERVNEHLVDTETVGHEAGVLTTGTTETDQRVVTDVVASLHRDLLDGIGHALHGDRQEPLGDLHAGHGHPRRGRDLGGDCLEAGHHDRRVQPLGARGTEDRREELGPDLAHHDVAVRDGQRTIISVAGRSGGGPRRLRANAQTSTVEGDDGPSPGCNRVHQHHRRPNTNTGDLCFLRALQVPAEMAHVGRGATHVEPDDPIEPGRCRGPHHADDATGRPGEQRVLSLEPMGLGEPPTRLHERQVHPVA